MIISFLAKLKPKDYKIIKQKKINTDKDNLIVGIYQPLIFKNEYYIICCNRIEPGIPNTLDYTKFAATKKHANILFNKVLAEVMADLER